MSFYYSAIDNHDDEINKNLLAKQWKCILPLILILYTILQVLMGYRLFGISCTDSHQFPFWVTAINVVVIFWFFISCSWILYRIALAACGRKADSIGALAANLTISLIAGSSSLLSFMWRWGGFCRDGFGVLSPAAQWPEWLTCVPLLFYVALSCDIKESLGQKDILMIALITTTIFTGFSLNFGLSKVFNVISLLLSCFSCVSVGFLAIDAQTELKTIVSTQSGQDNRSFDVIGKETNPFKRYRTLSAKAKELEFTIKKRNIAWVCLVGMPIFPLIYFLALFRLLDDDTAYSATMIASMMVKSVIASIVSENNLMNGFEDLDVVVARGNLDRKVEEVRKNVEFASTRFYKVHFQIPTDVGALDETDSQVFMKALHGYRAQDKSWDQHNGEPHTRRGYGPDDAIN